MTVRSVLDSHGRSEILDAVELLSSEMVTNAYRHTSGPASLLRLTALADGRLRVGGEGGRGLCLVQEYADCWGGRPLGDGLLDRGAGKLLWFEVGG